MSHLDANYYFLLNQLHSDAERKRSQLTDLQSDLALTQKSERDRIEQQSRLELQMIGQQKTVELLETRCSELSSRCSELAALVDRYSKTVESMTAERQSGETMKADLMAKEKEVENLQHVLNLQDRSLRTGRPCERCCIEPNMCSDYGWLKQQLQQVNMRLQEKTDRCDQLDRRLSEAMELNVKYQYLLARNEENPMRIMMPERRIISQDSDAETNASEDEDEQKTDSESESTTYAVRRASPNTAKNNRMNALQFGHILGGTSPYEFSVSIPTARNPDEQIYGFESALNLIDEASANVISGTPYPQLDTKASKKTRLLTADVSSMPIMFGRRSPLERSISDRVQSIRRKYLHGNIGKRLDQQIE